MNNIMIDKELAIELMKISIDSAIFGTPINEGGHDEDRFFNIPNLPFINNAPFNTSHWLHYKGKMDGKNVDYLFCTSATFYRGLLNGSSHIPMEVLISNGTQKSIDSFFRTFKMIKCYLGLARKDIKQAEKIYESNNRQVNDKFHKKVKYIQKGLNLCAFHLGLGQEDFSLFKNPLSTMLDAHDTLRDKANKMLDDGSLPMIYEHWQDDVDLVTENDLLELDENLKAKILMAYEKNACGK